MKTVKYILAAALFLLLLQQAPGDLLARFRTSLGDILVQLYDKEKPVTVSNFVHLVETGAYSNNFFHRCIPGFIVQGGGTYNDFPTSTNVFLTYDLAPNFGPITNEYAVGAHYSNVYGTIAMAKTTNSPDTATSQWFFNLADNAANLDNQNGGFTVFGHVLYGTNVLNAFNARSMSNGIVNLGGMFTDLPVTYTGWFYPRYKDLVYVDINFLCVAEITGSGNTQTITWESAMGLTNHLEYSTGLMAGSWIPLLTTNGTGSNVSVIVTNDLSESRFYRIRVE